jgi:hypothetical protein
MGRDRLRAIAIALFAAGALLAGAGNSLHQGWLLALAFSSFAIGVAVFFRWRQALRARVFDQEDKTPE